MSSRFSSPWHLKERRATLHGLDPPHFYSLYSQTTGFHLSKYVGHNNCLPHSPQYPIIHCGQVYCSGGSSGNSTFQRLSSVLENWIVHSFSKQNKAKGQEKKKKYLFSIISHYHWGWGIWTNSIIKIFLTKYLDNSGDNYWWEKCQEITLLECSH